MFVGCEVLSETVECQVDFQLDEATIQDGQSGNSVKDLLNTIIRGFRNLKFIS